MNKVKYNPWLIAVVVSLATFMEVLDTTITNVSLRNIAGSLGAVQDESTWIISSYLMANGIILPLSGWLSDFFGRKRFFIVCILGFTLASFFCGAANSLTSLIIFRIIQGAAGGGLQPTQQAIILDLFPPEKRGAVFGITGITMIVAPILGPTLGGLITDNFSWRWIFYINIPVGIIAAMLVWQMVEEPAQKIISKNIDFIGIGLVSLGLACLQYVLDKGQQDDWFNSHAIVIFALISFISLSIAIIWLWDANEPIIDLSLFKEPSFAIACILIFVMGYTLYSGSAMMPLMLQSQFGYTSTLAGYILSPGGMSVILFMPFVGKLVTKVPLKYLIFIGMSMCSFGMLYSSIITPQTDFNSFVIMRILQVLGLPFLFIPISALAFSKIPKEKQNKASALFALFRNIGGSIGISITTTLLVRREQFHQHHISENFIAGSANYQNILANISQHTKSIAMAKSYLYMLIQKQSAILGFIDVFYSLGVLMALAAISAFIFIPKNKSAIKSDTATGH